MSRLLVVCPSHRDRRELALLEGCAGDEFLFHEYASDALERMLGPSPPRDAIGDAASEIERIVTTCRDARVDGVVSTDDYPGTALAAIVARRLGLPGTDPRSCLVCQHKYHARLAQRKVLPEVVPSFALLDGAPESRLAFPCIVKPVKSFFSIGGQRVDHPAALARATRQATLPECFFAPFRQLFEAQAGIGFGRGRVIAEGWLQGRQATVEGYALAGDVQVIGIVDSDMFPGTSVFRQFEYPSSLPESVQARMADATATVMRGLGFDHGLFNVEFMVSPDQDAIHIIEINPRMASQFADLYEKVDGLNSYATLLDLALGKRPQRRIRQGRHAMAVSHVLRRFRDARVLRVPSARQLDAVRNLQADVRVEVLATEGRLLSEELQDGCSYRYGMLDVGGRDRQEIAQVVDACCRLLPFTFAGEAP